MDKKDIKIFVTYKDKHKIIKSDIITPIQTGRAIADEVFEGMIGDDTGDNISKENPKYNELSAQYWVWKHYEEIGNPNYIGFRHYRRLFFFDKNIDITDKPTWNANMPIFVFEKMDNNYLKNLSDTAILDNLKDSPDAIVFKSYDVNLFRNNDLYMREHYISTIPGAKRVNWDVFYDVVSELYPQYKSELDDFTYGHFINPCNMFIMKKDLFFECSEMYFKILKEVDLRVDSSQYNSQEMRFCGYLGEYILTLFVIILQRRNNLKIKMLNGVLIKNTDGFLGINFNSKFYKNYLQQIFSVKNDMDRKVITIFGIKIKFKRKIAPTKIYLKNQNNLLQQNSLIFRQMKILEDKLSELQYELILLKRGKNE